MQARVHRRHAVLWLACGLLAACAPTESDDGVHDVVRDDGRPGDADASPESETDGVSPDAAEDAPPAEGTEDGGPDGEAGPEDVAADDGEPDGPGPDAEAEDHAVDDAGRDEAVSDDAAAEDGVVDDAGRDEVAADDGGAPPYRHTITVDGDPTAWDDVREGFALTTASTAGHPHRAWVAWDDTYLFVAWRADAVAELDDTKWLQLYLDLDPPAAGAPTGATTGVTYRTQQPAMPTGFGAEVHIRWSGRAAGDYFSRMQYSTPTGWSDVATPSLAVVDAGTFVELRVAWADLYFPTQVGLVGFLLDEQELGEWTWGGLYADNFVDGYFSTTPLSRWLLIDRDDSAAPNDPAHRRP